METQNKEETPAVERENKALEGAEETPSSEATQEDAEVVTDDDGQVAVFPSAQKISNLTNDIEKAYKSVATRIRCVADHGGFFKKFADFVQQMELDSDYDVCAENLRAALHKAKVCEGDIVYALAQMAKAQELEEKLDEIQQGEKPEKLTDQEKSDAVVEALENGGEPDGE